MPAVVTAAAERFERFTPEGIPRRSWLRLRLERVPDESQAPVPLMPPDPPPAAPDLLDPDPAPQDPSGLTHTTLGGGEPDGSSSASTIARRHTATRRSGGSSPSPTTCPIRWTWWGMPPGPGLGVGGVP
jgi:hypothetical protein